MNKMGRGHGMTRDEKMYDERQLKIFMRIFRHGFAAAAILLAVNAGLQYSNIAWASAYGQNLILSTIAVSIVFGEAHIRGVWFGKGHIFPRIVMIFLGVAGAIILMLSIIDLTAGEKYFADGAITNSGVNNLQGVLYLLIASLALVQYIRAKRHKEIQ